MSCSNSSLKSVNSVCQFHDFQQKTFQRKKTKTLFPSSNILDLLLQLMNAVTLIHHHYQLPKLMAQASAAFVVAQSYHLDWYLDVVNTYTDNLFAHIEPAHK